MALTVRRLENQSEIEQVYRLVHDEFVKMTYIEPQPDGRFVHYAGRLDGIPQTDILGAFEGDELVGTNTLTADSEHGLHMGREFPLQLMRERLTGHNLASSWRIVTRSDRRDGAIVVRSLFRATIKRMAERGLHTLLCTFNPDHMCHYRLSLNMQMIGFSESNESLHNAPTVLMRGHIDELPARWMMREL